MNKIKKFNEMNESQKDDMIDVTINMKMKKSEIEEFLSGKKFDETPPGFIDVAITQVINKDAYVKLRGAKISHKK